MWFYFYLLSGFLGGIPAGMGMGGGTITIPFLTLIFHVPQKIEQSSNLFAFLPTGLLSLQMHKKNGFLETEGVFPILLSALIFAALGGVIATLLPSPILRKGFGFFLIFLSIYTFKKGFSSEKG
jgi:uncharacterized membrane protein YfcA